MAVTGAAVLYLLMQPNYEFSDCVFLLMAFSTLAVSGHENDHSPTANRAGRRHFLLRVMVVLGEAAASRSQTVRE